MKLIALALTALCVNSAASTSLIDISGILDTDISPKDNHETNMYSSRNLKKGKKGGVVTGSGSGSGSGSGKGKKGKVAGSQSGKKEKGKKSKGKKSWVNKPEGNLPSKAPTMSDANSHNAKSHKVSDNSVLGGTINSTADNPTSTPSRAPIVSNEGTPSVARTRSPTTMPGDNISPTPAPISSVTQAPVTAPPSDTPVTTQAPVPTPFGSNEDTPLLVARTRSPTTMPDDTSSPTPTPISSVTQAPVPASPSKMLISVGNGGEPFNLFPLLECHGDCDSDDECSGANLRCFGRTGSEAVPGCSGAGTSGDDYCFDASGYLVYVSNSDGTNPIVPFADKDFRLINTGLFECAGDCDSDDDCADNLRCFHRSANVKNAPVPGCNSMTGLTGMDYCYDASGYLAYVKEDSQFFATKDEEGDLLLGLCEGDCDFDSDCRGDLVCGQRASETDSPPGGCLDPYNNVTVWLTTDFCCDPATSGCTSSEI